MASPAGPRLGWSRRAQSGMFFGFLALIAGTVVGVVLLAISLVAPRTFDGIRGAALDVTAPLTKALYEVRVTVTGVVTGAGDYWNAASQNAELKRDRKAMQRQIIQAKAVLQENRQLKAALALRDERRETLAVARVVGSSFSSPRRFAILSVGSNQGVQIGMPVRSPDGLVGRILDTGATASRVLLVSDRAAIVPGRLLRNGMPVIAQGRGDGTVDVRPLDVGRNPFRRGDIIITSGTGGLYPPLVPVARVMKLDDDGAIAVPLADPATTSFALIEPAFQPEALTDQSDSDPEGS